MADQYNSFEELATHETEGVDYRLSLIDRQASIVIIAPHGGYIESGTSEISVAIASDEYSLYCFEGLKPARPHGDLHIESSFFDEPNALRLAASAEVVVGVHGRRDRDDPQTVWVGGRDEHLRYAITKELAQAGFSAIAEGHSFLGVGHNNICNRGKNGAGVQLEIPKALRTRIQKDSSLLRTFAMAVRNALSQR